jgi:tetratricopeptide (TPR) repeat protein
MAGLLEYSKPEEALEWINKGLDHLQGESAFEESALRLKASSLHMAQGDYQSALLELESTLPVLPEEAEWLRAGAFVNFSTIYGRQGEFKKAGDYASQAKDIYTRLNDLFRLVDVWTILGMISDFSEDWAGAAASYERALESAERLGSVLQQARLHLNLGILKTNQGSDPEALNHFTKAIEFSQEAGILELEVESRPSLAQLYIRQGELGLAEGELIKAGELVEETGVKDPLAEINRNWAELYWAKGQLDLAKEYAEKAIELAGEANERERALALRVLGQISFDENPRQAKTLFEESVSVLSEIEPYEAARTKLVWGAALLNSSDKEKAALLFKEARQTFQRLGARRDLAEVDNFTEDLINIRNRIEIQDPE